MTGVIKSFGLLAEHVDTFEAAFERARDFVGKGRDSQAIALMATEFLRHYRQIRTMDDFLLTLESALGVRLVAYHPESDQLVYGGEFLDELVAMAEAEGTEIGLSTHFDEDGDLHAGR